MDYHNTLLWKKTLGLEGQYNKEIEFLRTEYEKMHESARLLAGEIIRTMPEYTVHDITHIDALWEMADLFLPKDYEITVSEGFVLGAAFLLHDLGMSLAAYPRGIESVQKEPLWRDTVAALCKQKNISYDFGQIDSLDEEIKQEATEVTVRALHASMARELGKMAWRIGSDKEVFLIDDAELRGAYGEIVGIIAQSHGWSSGMIRKEFPAVLGAMSRFPPSWTVDPMKLACIIRIADAMDMEDRRAPLLLRAVRSFSDYSMLHWVFQEKLYQPRVINNRVEYTSKSAFSVEEIDAWWLCYDLLVWLDVEFRNVDALLSESGRNTFGIIGISGIDDFEELTKRIAVDGWKPIDTRIKVSNVARLVHTLGGKDLYGNNHLVPLRETIQNATDSIRARRFLDGEDDNYGTIIVSLGTDGDSEFIEIEDNGIGMSADTMINVLLDFGQSFWGTAQMHREFPGLEQTEFQSTGKFGIGFFSVFMWGKHIKIVSNRYDRSRDDTMVLEFSAGLEVRPVLRRATPDERIRYGGTRIRIYLSEYSISDIFKGKGLLKEIAGECIAQLCPNIDCNLVLSVDGEQQSLICANDWLSIDPKTFMLRLMGSNSIERITESEPELLEMICKSFSLIEEQGRVVGRASLFPIDYLMRYTIHDSGCVTVGGLAACGLRGICGILIGTPARASRDVAFPIVSQTILDQWVQEQANALIASGCTEELQLNAAEIACALSKTNTALKIAIVNEHHVNYAELVDSVRSNHQDRYILLQNAAIETLERDVGKKVMLYSNVIVCEMGIPGILQTKYYLWEDRWPKLDNDEMKSFYAKAISRRVADAIAEGWEVSEKLLEEQLNHSEEEEHYYKIPIGTMDGREIEINAYVLEKNTK